MTRIAKALFWLVVDLASTVLEFVTFPAFAALIWLSIFLSGLMDAAERLRGTYEQNSVPTHRDPLRGGHPRWWWMEPEDKLVRPWREALEKAEHSLRIAETRYENLRLTGIPGRLPPDAGAFPVP